MLLLEAEPEQATGDPPEALAGAGEATVQARLNEVSERNARHFDAEVAKLDRWAEDLKLGLEQQIKELDREIREARRQSAAAPRLEDKLESQRTLRRLETERRNKRRDLFEEQDRIDAQRDDLIARIEKQMERKVEVTPLFTVRWTLEA
jgi:adenine-specific DNA-methyltransferase